MNFISSKGSVLHTEYEISAMFKLHNTTATVPLAVYVTMLIILPLPRLSLSLSDADCVCLTILHLCVRLGGSILAAISSVS